jgi:rhamnose utilization protein RhaD (predicted bifunctional aldolase and dehydrogenase)
MNQNDWLTRMHAAVDAAFGAACPRATLDHLHAAGILAVRARAAASETGGEED